VEGAGKGRNSDPGKGRTRRAGLYRAICRARLGGHELLVRFNLIPLNWGVNSLFNNLID